MASPVPSDAVAAPLSCGAHFSRAPLLARLPLNAGSTRWRRPARDLRREPINHASAPLAPRRSPVPTPVVARKIGTRSNSSMDYGLVLFTSDRGISPAAAATLADNHGFATFYVPEHTHIPVKRQAAHPTTGDESLPDDRYMRTLDPWVSLGTAAAVTSRVRLSTAV